MPHRQLKIWCRFGAVSKNGSAKIADRVEAVIRERIAFLATAPGAGHWRRDLTDEPVKFFAVYSYLIIYRPETSPLQVVAILHGHRDVELVLRTRA